jgi:phage terminase large subunit-like protein
MNQKDYAAVAKRYARDVVAGKIPACRWVKLACERQLSDLQRFKGKQSLYRFNPKLKDRQGKNYYPVDNLCGVIERLTHVKGPLAETAIQLEPWQIFILLDTQRW